MGRSLNGPLLAVLNCETQFDLAEAAVAAAGSVAGTAAESPLVVDNLVLAVLRAERYSTWEIT